MTSAASGPGAAERGEHWWPVALAILVTAVLHVALPAQYRVHPIWVVPAVLLALLAALIIGDSHGIADLLGFAGSAADFGATPRH